MRPMQDGRNFSWVGTRFVEIKSGCRRRETRWAGWLVISSLLLWSVFVETLVGQSAGTVASDRANEQRAVAAAFSLGLQQIADRYGAEGRADLREATLGWLEMGDTSRRVLYLPPEQYREPGPQALTAKSDSMTQQWRTEVKAARESYAARLFELGKQGLIEGDLAGSGPWLWESLWQNPDQPELRKILAYEGIGLEVGPVVVKVSRRAEPQLGWPSGSYREGTSVNFRLLTNADEKSATELLRKLQVWRLLWRQVCLPYWVSGEGVAAAVRAGRPLPGGSESRHQVVLFANRADFLRVLGRVPGIEQSVGYYDAAAARCYFYLDPQDENLQATQLHELAHQLFQETGRRVRQPGEKTNFWLLEAAAMYFESMQPVTTVVGQGGSAFAPKSFGDDLVGGQRWSIGGFDAQRLQFARLRVQREGFFVPLPEMVRRGRKDFQQVNDLPQWYSQAAGLFHFLMQDHPQAVFAMLSKTYAGRDRLDLLESEVGIPLGELEQAYRKWLNFAAEEHGPFLRVAGNKRELVLGFSHLTDQHLEQLKAPDLQLMQLTRTQISDLALERLAVDHRKLKSLYLDGTAVSDRGVLSLLRVNPHLESVDLADTQITDQTVEALGQLPQLEELWLTNTSITDAAVGRLLEMPRLTVLDVQGTKLSPAMVERLRQRFGQPR